MTDIVAMETFDFDPNKLPALYAITADGNCLGDLIPNGSKVILSRDAEPESGAIVCIYLHRDRMDGWNHQSILKKMIGWSIPDISSGDEVSLIVEQLNPPRRYAIPHSNILAVHTFVRLAKRGELRPGQVAPKPKKRSHSTIATAAADKTPTTARADCSPVS